MTSGGAPVWPPKILLAKPAAAAAAAAGHANPGSGGGAGVQTVKLMRDEDGGGAARARLTGSLNLITESWDFSADRFLPLMTDNADFTVVGVLGLPGVGKSTILNELYGFDGTTSGVLPPFPVQSEETKTQARHCTAGMELRVSSERLILLDTQPIYSPSVLMDLTRPDGSSTLQLLNGETISAELAHEIMALQLGVFLTAVCHVVIIVTDGLHDTTLWKLMRTVEMLRQGIPDPSAVGQVFVSSDDITAQDSSSDFFSDAIFVHTKLRENELTFNSIENLRTALSEFFNLKNGIVGYSPWQIQPEARDESREAEPSENASRMEALHFFVLPRGQDEFPKKHVDSSSLMLRQLRDQILSMPRRSFVKPLNERDWLRNASRVWDLVKRSPVISDYAKLLLNSGLFRR